MELSLSSQSLLTITKTLIFTPSHLHRHHCLSHINPNFSRSIATLRLSHRLRSSTVVSNSSPCVSHDPLFTPVHRVPCSTAFFASSSGGGDGYVSGLGGSKIRCVSGGSDDVPALSADAIVLDVGGMTCGGCAASVKRILENQPQVGPNWQQEMGEKLANQLTNCGFQSSLRGQEDIEGNGPK